MGRGWSIRWTRKRCVSSTCSGISFSASRFRTCSNSGSKTRSAARKCCTGPDYEQIAANRPYFGDFDPFGDFDLIFAAKLNLKIVEIPIHYRERTYGTTQISRFQHGWLLLQMCVFAMRKIKFV